MNLLSVGDRLSIELLQDAPSPHTGTICPGKRSLHDSVGCLMVGLWPTWPTQGNNGRKGTVVFLQGESAANLLPNSE